MGRTLLMVGAGSVGRSLVELATRAGMRVHLVEQAIHAPDYVGLVEGFHPIAGCAEEHWVGGARAAAAICSPDAVLAFAEPQVLAAALVAEARGLPGLSAEAALTMNNKALQRIAFAQAGVAQPEFLLSADADELFVWAATRYPVIVKPHQATGSAPVTLVEGPQQLAEVIARRPNTGSILVEEYVDGTEYSWEGFVHDGSIVFGNYTEKTTTGPPDFVEIGHLLPVQFSGQTAERVARLTEDVVRAIGVATGIVHLEFRIACCHPGALEVAVCTAENDLLELLTLAYGADCHAALIDLAFGRRPTALDAEAAKPASVAAVRYLAHQPGVLGEVLGQDQLEADECVVRHRVSARPGDTLPALRSSADRRAYAVLCAPDEAALRAAIDRTLDGFRLRTTGDMTMGASPASTAVR
jgi:biotin carboxylase